MFSAIISMSRFSSPLILSSLSKIPTIWIFICFMVLQMPQGCLHFLSLHFFFSFFLWSGWGDIPNDFYSNSDVISSIWSSLWLRFSTLFFAWPVEFISKICLVLLQDVYLLPECLIDIMHYFLILFNYLSVLTCISLIIHVIPLLNSSSVISSITFYLRSDTRMVFCSFLGIMAPYFFILLVNLRWELHIW